MADKNIFRFSSVQIFDLSSLVKRLVARGFRHKYGITYDETYAQVVPYITQRSFLTAAAYHNHNVNHTNIKIAFLHVDLEGKVYMSQPEEYINTSELNKVSKLKKDDLRLKRSSTILVYKNYTIS